MTRTSTTDSSTITIGNKKRAPQYKDEDYHNAETHPYLKRKGKDGICTDRLIHVKSNMHFNGFTKKNPSLSRCTCMRNCGALCENRRKFIECTTCNLKDKCGNRNIQQHKIVPGLERFETAKNGYGLRTNNAIKKDTFILEYTGLVMNIADYEDRKKRQYANDNHHYLLHLEGDLVIDAHSLGSDCRYVNHSCEPNCEMQKWSVGGLPRMALFAKHDIPSGEELTYDYNLSLFNPAENIACLCESAHCSGFIKHKPKVS